MLLIFLIVVTLNFDLFRFIIFIAAGAVKEYGIIVGIFSFTFLILRGLGL